MRSRGRPGPAPRHVADRCHLVEGPARAGGQDVNRLDRVAVVAHEIFRGGPVVDHLVVVPLKEGGQLLAHGAQVLIEKVVFGGFDGSDGQGTMTWRSSNDVAMDAGFSRAQKIYETVT